jgi:predicted DCC family thiol-disulfide oxidoreductase YuxK
VINIHGQSIKTVPSNKAPELVMSLGKVTSFKKVDFTDQNYLKTLLVFYQSECEDDEAVMKYLSSRQDEFQTSKIRLIAVSGDVDQKTFEDTSQKLQWNGILSCDMQGVQGINFLNYGIQETPTLFVIDQKGNILARENAVEPVLNALADPSKELWRKIRRPPRPGININGKD